jgi:uncharacterized membrane protein YphA (DoxX/SURF4 family)
MKEHRNLKHVFATISRFLVGLVFIFSSFAKGVDPLGTAYRIEDYFVAYGTIWANSLAFGLAVFLCAFEFTIGMAVLFKTKMKITSWLLLAMMLFFTFLTFFDAIYEPVPDCGCFGDALKLSNWQTFYKNIVLMVFVGMIFTERKNFKNKYSEVRQALFIVLFFVTFVLFSMYNYRHLPLIDFTKWKTGTKVISEEEIESQTFVKYRNINSGEEKEYLSPDYPWKDTVWMREWQFVDQRVVTSGNQIELDLYIEDESGNDLTRDILLSEKMFIVTIPDVQSVDSESRDRIIRFYNDLHITDCNMVVLSGSLPEEILEFKQLSDNQIEVYFADATVLKTMVRSNPGIVLFNEGVIIKKWHIRDIPEITAVVDILSRLK